MPHFALTFLKFHAQKILIYLQNCGDDARDGEVRFHELAVNLERTFAIYTSIVSEMWEGVEVDELVGMRDIRSQSMSMSRGRRT